MSPTEAVHHAETLLVAGRLDEAEPLCQAIVSAVPFLAAGHRLLAIVAYRRANLPLALVHVERALALDPVDALAHDNRSLFLAALGRHVEAEAAAREALRLQPDLAGAAHNLGVALLGQGRDLEAETSLRRAVHLDPDGAPAWINLTAALARLGRFPDALLASARAVRLAPDSPLAQANLTRLRVVGDASAQGIAENNRGVALLAARRFPEAEEAFRTALVLDPELPAAVEYNLGLALEGVGDFSEAERQFLGAIRREPAFVQAHLSLANLCFRQRRLTDAEASYLRILELQPDHADALDGYGANVLTFSGRHDEAERIFRRVLAVQPHHAASHSNLLLNEQYRPGVDLDRLARLHREWDDRHGVPSSSRTPPMPGYEQHRSGDPKRPLRVGFVSGDFCCHPVGLFLAPVLERLDRTAFLTVCYANQSRADEMTGRLSHAAGLWRNVHALSDDDLAQQIRQDGIDVLIDLSGHTGNHRLPVFARRPASIQATWLGYVGTTGLAAIDYLVADRFHVPPGQEHRFRERILWLPDGYLCYEPPGYSPDVGPLPALARGHLTFGSFNSTAKVNLPLVAAWAEILRRLPGTRLVLKYHWLDDAGLRQRIERLFAGEGIARDRLDLLGGTSHVEHLRQYQRIDLALDPFPYSGGLTTCEACWMGVPVLTCPGETFASRHSLAHLSNLGMTETIAQDVEDYVDRAVAMANDLPWLAEMRRTLRARMACSPLCDRERFTRHFAELLRAVSGGP